MESEYEYEEYVFEKDDKILPILRVAFTWVGLPLLCSIGCFVNVLSIAVLVQKRMRSSPINILLTALQFSDLLVVLSLIFVISLESIFDWNYPFHSYVKYINPWVQRIAQPILNFSIFSSVYFTVLITIDRYIAVCHPLKLATFSTIRRALFYCLIVGVFSAIFILPYLFEFEVQWDMDEERYVQNYTEFSGTRFYYYYSSYASLIFYCIIPILILIILNVTIHQQIRASKIARRLMQEQSETRGRAQQSRPPPQDNSLTFILFAIVILFFICTSFRLVTELSWHLGYYEKRWNKYFIIFRDFFQALNSSANFFFYCAFGKKFRGELVIMIKNNCISNKLQTLGKKREGDAKRNSNKSTASCSTAVESETTTV